MNDFRLMKGAAKMINSVSRIRRCDKKIGQPLDHRSSDMQLRDLHGKWGIKGLSLGNGFQIG